MSLDLSKLTNATRLLFSIPLQPVQGQRFQPTGFPNLGAAFNPKSGVLLVESAQSMANWLESTIWDDAKSDLIAAANGLSHIKVTRNGGFFTDSILESHRINSPYILRKMKGKNKGAAKENSTDKNASSEEASYLDGFAETLSKELGVNAKKDAGKIDRHLFAKTLFKYDVGSLIHGAFLEKLDGRLRVARCLSAFIEAENASVFASGGAKVDGVNPVGLCPSWQTGNGIFGNVPFARDEYVADRIFLHVNIDLSQIRGYGFDDAQTHLLYVLVLFKLRTLLSKPLKLRSACDFEIVNSESVFSSRAPVNFDLPTQAELESELKKLIATNRDAMKVTIVAFDDVLKKESKKGQKNQSPAQDRTDSNEDVENDDTDNDDTDNDNEEGDDQ